MNKGDKLYQWMDNGVETYIFLEESIAEGATVPSWLIRKLGDNQKIRITIDNNLRPTKQEAIKDYLCDLALTLNQNYRMIRKIRKQNRKIEKMFEDGMTLLNKTKD